MREIVKIQKMMISKNQEIAIVTKYPFWMKYLIRFVKCYIVPDTQNWSTIYHTTFPMDVTDSLMVRRIKSLPSTRIGEVA